MSRRPLLQRLIPPRWRREHAEDEAASSPTIPSAVALEGDYEHEWIHTRGIRLHAATAGDPHDPLIVFVHGALGGWFDYRHILPTVAAAGFHCVAIDMRGFGMSDKPPSDYDLRTLAGDVYGVIHATGHQDALVVGHAAGGAVGWALAIHHPEAMRGLVSIAASHPTDLRRATFSYPWLFGTPIIRHAGALMPSRVHGLVTTPQSTARVNLVANTAEGFHATSAGRTELQLRTVAYSIANTSQARAKVARIELAPVPLRWMTAPVNLPVLLIQDSSTPWEKLAERAAKRVTSTTKVVHIPHTKNIPHLEAPASVSSVLVSFARSL
ncbi:Soluble epoxide hydrolase [Corynebacterium ciconiae DSM 44920]|uniref:alpha/beta fold hydrolase n=1 Tax=Corynebacterium ciconiae TaxID=227319 RepID=UPI00035DE8AB|nr:alpha/beta hydrolase [Corynebacterium ciconiae]WKD62195.1 Soluble epoxide hydrolase [Corynebacterium ciconiae DSM 44920]